MSSVGSGVLLDEDFEEDENDPYRIASTPLGRQQRSMSFDVAASGSVFTRPRSASVDVLDNRSIQTSLLRQRLSGDNEYMNPDIENNSSDNIYLNTEKAGVKNDSADDCHYKNMSGCALAEIPECSESQESVTKIVEDYLVPVDHEKHEYSLVQDDLGTNRPLLERQYSEISDEPNDVIENGLLANGDNEENPYEMAY